MTNATDQLLEHNDDGLVVSKSRRWLTIRLGDHSEHLLALNKGVEDYCIGDIVRLGSDHQSIEQLHPRKNTLFRQIGTKRKTLCGNLDLLCVMTAPPPLLNFDFIDRVQVACEKEGIEHCILLNKSDLLEDSAASLPQYPPELFAQSTISAKFQSNLEALSDRLSQADMRIVAFTGVSGVGKSSLLNSLAPEVDRRTSGVSEKTGQGRQTTSQAFAFYVEALDVFIVDLPGIQNFGISHVSPEELPALMPDLSTHAERCEFGDCSHIEEDNCAVKEAVESGELAPERYRSYESMRDEILRLESYERRNL